MSRKKNEEANGLTVIEGGKPPSLPADSTWEERQEWTRNNASSVDFDTLFGVSGVRLLRIARVAEIVRYTIQQTLYTLQSVDEGEGPFLRISETARERIKWANELLDRAIDEAVTKHQKEAVLAYGEETQLD